MRVYLAILTFHLFFITGTYAKSLDAHVHGDVYLDIATDNKQLLVMLKTPSETFLGFEYKAKTNKEKKLVKDTKEEWNNNLLNFLGKSISKSCNIDKSNWEQKFSGKNHSSILAESYISCSKPLKRLSIQVSFKSKYKRIKSIKVQLLRENGTTLSKKYSSNKFKINL